MVKQKENVEAKNLNENKDEDDIEDYLDNTRYIQKEAKRMNIMEESLCKIKDYEIQLQEKLKRPSEPKKEEQKNQDKVVDIYGQWKN